jgi:hypothetical protein
MPSNTVDEQVERFAADLNALWNPIRAQPSFEKPFPDLFRAKIVEQRCWLASKQRRERSVLLRTAILALRRTRALRRVSFVAAIVLITVSLTIYGLCRFHWARPDRYLAGLAGSYVLLALGIEMFLITMLFKQKENDARCGVSVLRSQVSGG